MLLHCQNELPTEIISASEELPSYSGFYGGNLIVEQDVTDCRLCARGNIHVYGQAFNCHLHSEQGSVFLEYGAFSGSHISAGTNIYVRSVSHATLQAREDVVSESSILYSNVDSGRCIFVEQEDGRVANSTLCAASGMFLSVVGGVDDSSPTRIRVTHDGGFIRFAELHPRAFVEIGSLSKRITDHYFVGKVKQNPQGLVISCHTVVEKESSDAKPSDLPAVENTEGTSFDFSVRNDVTVCTITLKGKLQATTVEEFDQSCLRAVGHEQALLLDVRDLSFLSSAGLRSILVLWKSHNQKKFAIFGAQPFIENVLEASGFASYMGVYQTRDEALRSILG